MVIIGAGMNHGFNCDMNYRGVINMLVMCGCVGQSGGGWSHYVGQEKLRPQTGWLPLAFALDWARPPRQQNSTSAFYAHTDQWRYETLDVSDILSPTAPAGPREGTWDGALIDYNVRAERMGWLPSAPQLETNPLEVARRAAASGKEAKDFVAGALKSGDLKLSCHDPDNARELATQPVRLALQPARLLRQGARVFPEAPAGHPARRDGQGPGRHGRAQAERGGVARGGA
jgi:nitrate reductase / nitrite oxidoreductase, alpha subunit